MNSWQEVRRHRIQSLRSSIEAFRAELRSYGASEGHIDLSLVHEYEMLAKMEAEEASEQMAKKVRYMGGEAANNIAIVKVSHPQYSHNVAFS